MPAPGATQRAAQKFIVFENFEKMNTQGVRQGLSEKELAWLENLQPIAGNNLRTVPAPIAALISNIGGTVQKLFFAALGTVDYIMVFTTNGAGYAVNIATGISNQFAPAGTFVDPDVTTWQASRILIVDPKNGYSTFDGALFIGQGGVSPVITITNGGSGYSSAPSVTISGGSGTGATAHSVISGGIVVAVILDNPGTGYQPTDTLTVTFGTGIGSGATGHVTMSGFPVASIGVSNPGSYGGSYGVTGTFNLLFTGGGGAGAAGTATLALSGGSIVSTNLTAGGSGYTTAPTCVIDPAGGPTPIFVNATFNVFLGTETVASIVLDAGGGGYVTPPTVTISGGGASTPATAHSTISAGAVNALILDTVGAGYTSTPTVIIGTGTGAAATARVAPFIGVFAVGTATSIAVFGGRVWISSGRTLTYTGTKGFNDFDSANASGSLTISDADLTHSIIALRNYNNYLWIVGDQSIKQIGNISLNTAGTVTLFTILTLSSDQGSIYPQSCASFNRVFMFANTNGIYAVFGSSVQKISDDMDGIWRLVDFTQPPQAAIADINGIHNVMFLVRYQDPLTGTTRSILLTFNGKKWFVVSQGNSLKAIVAASTLASGKTFAYGSSGTDITNILAAPNTAVTFLVRTALTHHGNAVQRKKIIRAGFTLNGTASNIVMTVDTENGQQVYTRPIPTGFYSSGFVADGSGKYLGASITGSLANFTFSAMALEYQESSLWS